MEVSLQCMTHRFYFLSALMGWIFATPLDASGAPCPPNTLKRVLVELTGNSDGKKSKLVETERHALIPAGNFNRNIKTKIGDRFRRLTDLPTFPLDRLGRYEHLLWRRARQLIFTLERLRQRRFQTGSASFPFSFQPAESSDQCAI
jgi:hypothetical protein